MLKWVISLAALVAAAAAFRQLLHLQRNYQQAKQSGLPIVLCPVYQHGPFWLLFHRSILPLFRLLPESLSTFTRLTYMGWEYADKGAIHQELGPAFMIVGPNRTELVLADPVSIIEVVTKYKLFTKPKIYEMHNIFGRNIITTEREEWARHKKLTAPCFNERVSRTVWHESSRQTQAMLELCMMRDHGEQHALIKDTKTIALHVLMSAGVGISQDFNEGVRKPQPGHLLAYGEALWLLGEHLTTILVLAPLLKAWLLPYLPARLRRISIAFQECRKYFDEMIDQEKSDALRLPAPAKLNLLNALVKASRDAEVDAAKGGGPGGMTRDEIRGNLYIFNFAGHETTANAMAYAVALLAANPKWQTWITEELDRVLAEDETGDYDGVFPKLKRCQALMYETLRLYGPATWIARETTTRSETIPLSTGGSIAVPPNTDVHLNIYAPHVSKAIWGPDALEFRPDRFIVPADARAAAGWVQQGADLSGGEMLVTPMLGSFSPWSLGPRICPGMKFAQVEFVAAICTLFSHSSVEPMLPDAKSHLNSEEAAALARRELEATIQDSGFTGVTLFVKKPGQIHLRYKTRK